MIETAFIVIGLVWLLVQILFFVALISYCIRFGFPVAQDFAGWRPRRHGKSCEKSFRNFTLSGDRS